MRRGRYIDPYYDGDDERWGIDPLSEQRREDARRPRVAVPCRECSAPTFNPPFCARHWCDERAVARFCAENRPAGGP